MPVGYVVRTILKIPPVFLKGPLVAKAFLLWLLNTFSFKTLSFSKIQLLRELVTPERQNGETKITTQAFDLDRLRFRS